MNLSIGIVGLPNVGKSTLFNALLKKNVADCANYPFCTIEPNVGIVEVPDERLQKLAQISKTEKIIHATVEFYDIAGIVKGASQGEGLGNKFLSHIREVSAIVHVVRAFSDDDIIHVNNKVDPKEDISIIETELILADLATVEKQKKPNKKISKEEDLFYNAIEKIKKTLDSGKPARENNLTEEELDAIKKLNLITIKPVIYLFNCSEEQLKENNTYGFENALVFSTKLESELVVLEKEEQLEYLKQYGLKTTGLDRLIKRAYKTLNLISFLTTGEKETRAWTIKKGTLAPQASGAIHTDFEKNFIRAEIVSYQDFVQAEGWTKAREKGLVHSVGKDYQIKDGDVVEFKIGRT